MSAAALVLALLAPTGGSWFCSAVEWFEPGSWAILQSRLAEGGGQLPSFHVRYIPKVGSAISQEMEWYDLPRWNEHLSAPDRIAFSILIAKIDRRGSLRFTGKGESWGVQQDSPFIHAQGGGGAWVEFQGYSERHAFWKGSGWTVEALDRLLGPMGSTLIRIPSPERLQQTYTRLRADLVRFEADPARHCEYTPPPVPGDRPQDEGDIT